jgi:hypothetical protein
MVRQRFQLAAQLQERLLGHGVHGNFAGEVPMGKATLRRDRT